MAPPLLLAVPNFSEGRSEHAIDAIGQALSGADSQTAPRAGGPGAPADGVRLLDVHSDRDHNRSVFTLAARQGRLAAALVRGARAALPHIDVIARAGREPAEVGQHPHVGALDVAPVVYLDAAARGAACAEALVLADRIGHELEVPVFLYGELTQDHDRPARTRADLRRGGVAALADRLAPRDDPSLIKDVLDAGLQPLAPDFGPARMHPTAGAALVAARPPLVAFNLALASPATLAHARAVAALIREGGAEGLPGVRAIGVALGRGLAQVSTNVERPLEVSLADVVEAVARHHRIDSAELVGLAPRAALEGFPPDLPMPGFDPARHLIENALRC
jgi:glutamate formiminotransferase / 5-formyltetrahydrofolate cyclo-ligase